MSVPLHWVQTHDDTKLIERFTQGIAMASVCPDMQHTLSRLVGFTYDLNDGYSFENLVLSDGTDLTHLLSDLHRCAKRIIDSFNGECRYLDIVYDSREGDLLTWMVIDYVSNIPEEISTWK